jgi:ATP-dependent Clp protease ATP-binding subunit ClpA
MTVEHLALQLIRDPEVAQYVERSGGNPRELSASLESGLVQLPRTEGEQDASPSFRRFFRAAIEQAEERDQGVLMVRHLVLALVDDRESIAGALLRAAVPNASVFDGLRSYISPEERNAA